MAQHLDYGSAHGLLAGRLARLALPLLLAAALLGTLAGCRRGGAYADLILSVVNRSPSAVHYDWSGSASGARVAGACLTDAAGLLEGSYRIRVTSASDSASFDLEVGRAVGDPPVRTVLVGADGRIDVDAGAPASLPPCEPTPAG